MPKGYMDVRPSKSRQKKLGAVLFVNTGVKEVEEGKGSARSGEATGTGIGPLTVPPVKGHSGPAAKRASFADSVAVAVADSGKLHLLIDLMGEEARSNPTVR